MTRKVRLLTAIIAILCMLSSFIVSAETTDFDSFTAGGALEATDDQVQYWATESESANKKQPNRTTEEAYIDNGLNQNGRSTGWIYTSRYFYYYKQETNYTCGPACVKMALKNITGITYSEEDIADGCNTIENRGTYLADMATYINEEQDHNYYLVRYNDSKANMQENLHDCLNAIDSCPIIGVRESTSAGWYYNLSAHFVIAYAVYSDMSKFLLTDPWIGYMGDNYSKAVVVSIDDLYYGYSTTNLGYMW